MGKKKKKKQKLKQPVSGLFVRSARLLMRPVRFAFQPRFLIPVALVATVWILQPRIRQLVSRIQMRPEYAITADDIRITEPPRWVAPDFVARIIEQNHESMASMSLLDEALPGQLADAIESHPWVLRVQRIQRAYPGRIVVEAEYRMPVAMVEVKQGAYPVDVEGVLLPPEDFAFADVRRFPAIRNVRSVPRGEAGVFWGDPVVFGAAQLAGLLQVVDDEGRSLAESLHVTAVEAPKRRRVSETLDDLVFALVTVDGTRIIWGRPPGTAHPGELTPEQKIGRLKAYRKDFGQWVDSGGPYEIDIRHWHEISRRSIAERPMSPRG